MNVLKIGGGAGIDHSAALENVARRVQRGERWIVVHGCSDAANTLAEQVGYPAQTITSPNGHTSRYTDARTIEIFSAAAGMVNQQITATLTGFGVQAVGLAGPNIITAQRKTAIRAIRNGRQIVIRDDYSGTITGINTEVLLTLLQNGFTPVVAPLAIGEAFERLNVDGDLVAATIARELAADSLTILSNVPGLLKDVQNVDSLINEFSLVDIDRYEAFAAGRMKKKLLAARQANVPQMILADARVDNPLDAAFNGAGTHILNTAIRELPFVLEGVGA